VSPPLAFPPRVDDGVVVLRPLREPDFAPFARAFADDPSLHRRVGRATPHTERSIAEETAAEVRARERGTWARFAIARARDDALGGALLLHDVSWRHRRAEVGLWVAPAGRGSGAGTRALALACRLVFGHLGFDRLQLFTETSNGAMRAVAARAGFREEGVLRAYQREPDGARADIVIAARLASDPPG
jgi:RimJ/RimL family protein N-acetyltransferase